MYWILQCINELKSYTDIIYYTMFLRKKQAQMYQSQSETGAGYVGLLTLQLLVAGLEKSLIQ